MNSRRSIFDLITCFGNSYVLSAAYGCVTGSVPVVPSIAARTLITVNH